MNNDIKKICCIGLDMSVGTMAVIAEKCPHINVNVVDINEIGSKSNLYESGLLK